MDGACCRSVVARYGHIDQIVITISAISGRQLDDIVELCRQYSPNVQVAPSLDELFIGKGQRQRPA